MKSETEPKRQNRTVTLYLGNILAEYEALISTKEGIEKLVRQVEVADSINWGHLADGHEPDCPRCLHFTHHDSYRCSDNDFGSKTLKVCELRSPETFRV